MDLEEFEKALRAHDWFYNMADDSGAYMRGSKRHAELVYEATVRGPEYMRLFNKIEMERFHNCGLPIKNPTFPEVK